MGQFDTYDSYGAMLDDEQRLDALRAKGDALTPQEVEEKLTLFRTLSTTGRLYNDIHNYEHSHAPSAPEAGSGDARPAPGRGGVQLHRG